MEAIGDRIRRAVAKMAPGAKVIRTWPLKGGISATMTAFEIEHQGGQRETLVSRQPGDYRFRQSPEAAAHEFRVLQTVRAARIPGPVPRFLDRPTEEHPQPFYVLEYVEGQPDMDPTNQTAFLTQYAQQLARIHSTPTASFEFLASLDPWALPDREEMNDALRESEIRAAWTLRPKLSANPTCLCHGDLWPGNVLWLNGEISGVIDWEEINVGDPLGDLAICRLDLLWVLGWDAMLEFTGLYAAATGFDLTAQPFWDLRASLRPITNLQEWYESYPLLGRHDITPETMTRDHQQFVAAALALVNA